MREAIKPLVDRSEERICDPNAITTVLVYARLSGSELSRTSRFRPHRGNCAYLVVCESV